MLECRLVQWTEKYCQLYSNRAALAQDPGRWHSCNTKSLHELAAYILCAVAG